MVEVKALSFSYGSRQALEQIDLKVEKGEFLAVLGANGAGKSTLLRVIARLLEPDSGQVLIDKRPLKGLSRNQLARTVAYLPQNSRPMDCSLFEAVLIGRRPYLGWKVTEEDLAETAKLLELVGLSGQAERSTMELSGGELQRVAIARTLAQRPELLLLDEPVNHLDIRNQMDLLALLLKLARGLGIAVIAVMHDLNLALRFAESFLVMQQGRVLAAGGREVINRQVIQQAYRLQTVLLEHDGIPLVIPCPEREPSMFGG